MHGAVSKTLRTWDRAPSTLLQIFLAKPFRATFALGFSLLLLMSAPDATAQAVKFTSRVTYPAGAPFKLASGDFNGDGKMDLVAADHANSNIVTLLGNGNGTLQAPQMFHLAAPPAYIATGDFNRDGKLDLASVSQEPAGLTILFGNGDGSFANPVTYTMGKSPGNIIVSDFNQDGWLDLALQGGNKDIAVLLNNGDGAFQNPHSYVFPESPGVLAAADFNGDGKIDLVTAFRIAKTANVLLGNGDGTFQTPISSTANSPLIGSGALCVVAADFDRDGKLDLALTDENLEILKGKGDGTFEAPSFNLRLHNTSPDLKFSDFNGDGKIDLVSAGVFGTGALQILLGAGDGTFQDAGDQISGNTAVSVVVTDLNGDTRPDLAANIGGQLAVALVNVTPGNVDNTDYFVHQQYSDFLEREPDANGFGFWSNEITSCGSDPACLQTKRVNVSAAFYLSIEFQQTAYLVERLYKVSYGDAIGSSSTSGAHQLPVPVIRLNDLLFDTQQISENVVVRQSGWETVLENNKQQFVNQFVRRSRFASAFPGSLTPAQFVDQLNQNSGRVLSSSDRAAAIALFGGAADSGSTSARAQALRQIAENSNLYRAEFNRAFVLMQYFGYLRRNPNEGQDTDYTGYEFWLNKLNDFNGNFINAEMVKAFISSAEYRNRFTQ